MFYSFYPGRSIYLFLGNNQYCVCTHIRVHTRVSMPAYVDRIVDKLWTIKPFWTSVRFVSQFAWNIAKIFFIWPCAYTYSKTRIGYIQDILLLYSRFSSCLPDFLFHKKLLKKLHRKHVKLLPQYRLFAGISCWCFKSYTKWLIFSLDTCRFIYIY